MAIPTTRHELIEQTKRRLGAPTIMINVTEEQLSDRLDDAIQFFQDWHYDGQQETYLKHTLTADDMTNEYITVDDDYIEIVHIYPITVISSINMFDVRYQFALNQMPEMGMASVIDYDLLKRHLNLLNDMLDPEPTINFNRHMNRVYIECNWGEEIREGDILLFKVYKKIDPEIYTDMYNDRWLKDYYEQLVKKQWGNNMKKFKDVQLPGGVTMAGQEMYDEAVEAITKMEEEMIQNNQIMDIFIG